MKLKGKQNYIYKWQKEKQQEERKTELSKKGFYSSPKWRKLRLYKLSINPLCEHCLKENKYRKGYIIDHIEAINNETDDKAYDINNLQTLCYYHHQRKTIIDNSKYSTKNLEKGKELQDELNDLD